MDMTQQTKPKRFNATEQAALLDLMGALELMDNHGLDRRLKQIPNGWRDIQMLRKVTERLLEKAVDAVPTEQLIQVRKNLKMLTVQVGVRRAVPDGDRELGRWMSHGALKKLAELCKEHCMMCAIAPGDRWKCPYRAAMDELPVELPEDAGTCPYFALWGEF